MTTTKTVLTLGALLISFNALGCAMNTGEAEAAERTGEAEEAIVNGSMDPSYPYRAVSMVINITPDSVYTPTACTGTLIASAWVLTAAHCVSHIYDGSPLDPSRIFVVGGGAVSQVHVMPGWNGKANSPVLNGYDVALLHLAGQAPYETTWKNLACTWVDATHGCLLTPYSNSLAALPADSNTLHCVSNGPRTAGGTFSYYADSADFVENDSHIYWPWYAYTANALGQRLSQTDEGGGCFSKLYGSNIRGSLLSVNSFESTYYGTPAEYTTTSDNFYSWVDNMIPPNQRTILTEPGGTGGL